MNKTTLPTLIILAFRQLLREIKAGELRILFGALLIAVTTSTAIDYFSTRLQASMEAKASDFLAADLVISGTSPASKRQLMLGKQLELRQAQTITFSTVLINQDNIQLVSAKAVDEHYPLRGHLKNKKSLEASEQSVTHGPNKGEIWAEQRLFIALEVKLGDYLQVGNSRLQLTHILTYEPDRSLDFYSLNPHILLNIQDLANTGTIQAGSRVSYRQLWAGTVTAINQYHQAIKATLAPNQQILTGKEVNSPLNSNLKKGENYLNLASLVAILLASVAVALSANQFALRRFDDSALLRCLGLTQSQVVILYTLQLVYLGLIACLLGAALGWAVQLELFKILTGLISDALPSGGIVPAMTGICTGLITLIGFAIPPLAALGSTPPIRVLRQNIFPTPPRSWLAYSLAILALVIIMWQLSLDIKLTLSLMGVGLLVWALCSGFLLCLLKSIRKLLANAALPWRLGLGQLLHYPLRAIGQIAAFSIILLAMTLIVLLRSELLETWRKQLPSNAPNYFAMNITPNELSAFQQRVTKLSPHMAPYYPIIAGRLTQVKGKAINELTLTGRGQNATQRDLNLTWSATLPAGNSIQQGTWWSALKEKNALPSVSLEDKLAESLQVTLGDHLSFVIAGVNYEVVVTSTRKINWNNFQPNFFVIFDPTSLHDIPATYLTSFYIAPNQDKQLVALARDFPTVTLLDIDGLLNQVKMILAQVSIAIEYILFFVLLAGISILFAGLQATLDNRIKQSALLRALGAKKQLLQQARLIEFSLLGAISGCFAAIGCEVISALLYHFILNLGWHFHAWLLGLPLIGAILISIIGLWGTRRATRTNPMQLLRENL